MNIINEAVSPATLFKRAGLEIAESEVEAVIKLEAKELAEKWYKEYLNSGVTLKNYRAGIQGTRQIPDDSVKNIIKQIETKTGKTVPGLEKAAFEREIKMAITAEKKAAVDLLEQESKEILKSVQKQETKKGTWEAIKEHIKRNKGKYALGAAALALAAYAYLYPGEKPEEEEEEPEPVPVPDPDEDGTYRYCPDFPFTKFCKNDKIREIQKCIDAKVDGYYGPETEGKLEENGYSTTITKEVFDEILEKCEGGGEDEPEPEPELEFEPTYDEVINN
jgi:hypothetical protein